MALTFRFDPVKIQFRTGTAAEWTAANPTLLQGEGGFEHDTGKFKVGDGTTAWTSLAYFNGSHWHYGAGAPGTVAGAIAGDYYLNTTNGDVYILS